MINDGTFIEDLYFRIGVVRLEVPSLNKRPEEILPIAKHFLMKFSTKFGKSFSGITPEAKRTLQQIQWRGNVRELKNIIERTTLIAKGPELTVQDIGTQEVQYAHELKNLPD